MVGVAEVCAIGPLFPHLPVKRWGPGAMWLKTHSHELMALATPALHVGKGRLCFHPVLSHRKGLPNTTL